MKFKKFQVSQKQSLNCIHKYFGVSQWSFLTPIADNPDFEVTCTYVGFRDWKTASLQKFMIYTVCNMMPKKSLDRINHMKHNIR